MQSEIRILMVEDNPDDAFLIERLLRNAGIHFACKQVSTRDDFNRALGEFRPDVIISDHSMPEFNSVEALDLCLETGSDAPFILVTGTVSEEFAVGALKRGAFDYILKDNMMRLPSSVLGAMERRQAEWEKRRRGEEIIRLNAELESRIVERTRELAGAKDFSEAIINALPCVFYALDGDLKVVMWNQLFLESFVPGGEVQDIDILHTVQPDHREALMRHLEMTLLVGHASSELGVITHNKEVVTYSIRSFRTSIDKRTLILVLGFDISEQKQVQALLKSNHENLQKLLLEAEQQSVLLKEANEETLRQKKLIEEEKKKADQLLTTILPAAVAIELKEKGHASAKRFASASVLFADLVDFTRLSKDLSAEQMVDELNWIFVGFDFIVDRFGLERVKTIGDGYMAVGGAPEASATHAEDAVNAALQMVDFIDRLRNENEKSGKPGWMIRIGVHSGEIVAGVIGKSKFSYDIWGTTVNVASRLESTGEAGKVNVSGTTRALVESKFNWIPRGSISVKNMENIEMYFATRK